MFGRARKVYPNPKGLPAATKALAQQSKSNLICDRVVVLTHGPTIAARSSSPDNVKTYVVNSLKDEEIVDKDEYRRRFCGWITRYSGSWEVAGRNY